MQPIWSVQNHTPARCLATSNRSTEMLSAQTVFLDLLPGTLGKKRAKPHRRMPTAKFRKDATKDIVTRYEEFMEIDKLTKLVSVYFVPEIETPDDDVLGSLKFSIHVFQGPNGFYTPKVLRKDRIYVEPAYFENRDGLLERAVIEVDVADDSVDWESIECQTEREAVSATLEHLARIFPPRTPSNSD